MTRENAGTKAPRYLTEGHIVITAIRPQTVVRAHACGDGCTYRMGWDGGTWWCSCPASAKAAACAHLIALRHVSRVTRERIALHGRLITISTEDNLVLRDASTKRTPLVEAETFAQDPSKFYDKDVVAQVEVELFENSTTGRESRTHHLLSLALDDGSGGSSSQRPLDL